MTITDLADLTIAKKAAEKPLCDHCLGRQFAKLDHGFSNKERGRALRAALPEHIKEPELCWLCENLFDELEIFSNLVIKNMQPYEHDTFLVGSKIDAEIVNREEILWGEL